MSKRFTDSDKWKDSWFCDLEMQDKLLWLYLLDDCNHAGIWKVNMRLLNFSIGYTYTLDTVVEVLGKRVFQISSEYLLIEKYLHFQYPNGLSANHKPQKAAIDMLLKHSVFDRVNKGYLKGNDTCQDTDTDTDTDTEKDKDKTSVDVEKVWNHYPLKKGKKKALPAIKKALEKYSVEDLLERVALYAKTQDPKYYAHGSTYFTGERYEDDLTPPKQTPQQMRGY